MRDIIRICRTRVRRDATTVIQVCCFWVIGLAFGRYLVDRSGVSSASIMQLAATTQPVILLQLFGQLLPLLITYAGVFFLGKIVVHPVVICHACVLGYTSFLCRRGFNSAGWLVYRILFFSDCISAIILLWIWLNVLKDHHYLTVRRFLCYSGILTLVVLFDYFVCSKFLLSVLT